MKKFLVLALVVLAAALCRTAAYAQATASATLLGTVTDKSGAVVPNATVSILEPTTGLTRNTKTADTGLYRFDLLPAGNYRTEITAPGFARLVFGKVEVSVAKVTTVDGSLEPSSQTEMVTVEAEASAVIDTSRSDISRPITPEEIKDLPLNGRDFANLAYLAPGTKPADPYDPTKKRVAVFATNGSAGRNVNVTVNGIDDKDNTVGGPVMQLPLEAILEFNISTQRFSAVNGRSEGAAVNVITKSGTNDPHGSIYFMDRNEALNANDYFSEQSHQSKSPYSRQEFGGSIGAPVRKDKDFLFFAIERQREATNIVVDPTSYAELSLVTSLGAQPVKNIPTPYFDWRYNGRYDHHFNENETLSVSYSNQNNRGLNDQSGSQNDLTAGNFTTNQLILASATLNSVLTARTVNSFTAGYQYWNNVIDSTTKVPNFTFPGGEYFGTNGNVPQESFQGKWQFRDDLSINRSRHTFQFGTDFVWEPKFGGFFEYNPTLTLTFFDDPSTILGNKTLYPEGFATPGAIQSMQGTGGDPYQNVPGGQKMFGLYFQDDWRIKRNFTLNLGVRWDKDYNFLAQNVYGKSRTYLALKAVNSPYAAIPPNDSKDFSPRIGFAWDLSGSGKHVIRGGYGIYFGQEFSNVSLFAVQQSNPILFTLTTDLNSSGLGDPNSSTVPTTGQPLGFFRFGIDPLPVPPGGSTHLNAGDGGRAIDPHYRNPYTQQWNIGYSYAMTNKSVAEVEYVHVLGLRESKDININPRRTIFGDPSRPYDAAFAAAGLPLLGRIQMAESIDRSRYDGLNVSYRKRMSRRFTVNTSYVFSKGVSYNGPAGDFYNRPSDLRNIFGPQDFGPTPTDEHHRLVLSGLVELPWGIKVAPIMQWASARPYTVFQGRSDLFGFGSGRGNTHVILLKDQLHNFLATKDYSVDQLRSCLADGSCVQGTFDNARGQVFYQLDTRFSKEFVLRERARLELIFQVFDFTNRANFGSNYQNSVRSSDFGKPIGFITPSGVVVPRSFSGEVGARFSF